MMLLRSPKPTALALFISIQALLGSCQSWNATGTENVTVSLNPLANNQSSGDQVRSGWSVSIGIAQRNSTGDNLLMDTIVQQTWANVTDDPACRSQLFNTTQLNVVCGISFVPNDTVHQQAIFQRMQNDPGDCSSAISESCRNDLSAAAVNYLKNNSMTAPSPYIQLCNNMAYTISKNLPPSCTSDSSLPYLLSAALGLDLLGFDKSQRCPNTTSSKRSLEFTISADRLTQTYQFDNKTISNFTEEYDYLVTRVSPILLVGYTVNGSSYPAADFINGISTEMICLRPSTIAEGSRTPSSVPDLSKSLASCLRFTSTSTVFFAAALAVGMSFVF